MERKEGRMRWNDNGVNSIRASKMEREERSEMDKRERQTNR